jgi:hypothetical protein
MEPSPSSAPCGTASRTDRRPTAPHPVGAFPFILPPAPRGGEGSRPRSGLRRRSSRGIKQNSFPSGSATTQSIGDQTPAEPAAAPLLDAIQSRLEICDPDVDMSAVLGSLLVVGARQHEVGSTVAPSAQKPEQLMPKPDLTNLAPFSRSASGVTRSPMTPPAAVPSRVRSRHPRPSWGWCGWITSGR